MAQKRPAKSQNDRSENPQNRRSAGSENNKRPYSSSRGKAADGERLSGKRAPKSYGNREGSTGEKKEFTPRNRPYTGRAADSDAPKRSFGNEGGDKKSVGAGRSKPYSGRPSAAGDRPKRTSEGYRGKSEDTGDRKFKSAGRPSTGNRTENFRDRKRSDDKPYGERSFSRGGDRPTGKRDFEKAPVKTIRGRKEKEPKESGLIRLNRYIANAGICSRRKADDLIAAGVVSVNGEVISELGHKVDPSKDEIRYNGELLRREKMVYVLLNKPKDYITTTEDPQERRTVMHLVEKASKERIYPIGRLDRNTTGLLLMTNDGDLADKLSHPRSNITKLYQVELSKSLTQGDLNKIAFGLELEDGLIKPDNVSYVQGGTKREIGIQIHSGKNRIVRRIFEHLGYEVVKLDRVVYAGLTKKDLPRGRWRYLEEKEIIQLKHLV